MWVTVAVSVWLLVLPWAVLPALAPDVSQRLLLACASALLGVITCSVRRHVEPLPRSWTWSAAWLAWTMGWRAWPVVRDGAYLQCFVETATWSDGLLVLLALWWGVWAWRQVPVERLRRIGPFLLVLLAINTIFGLAQLTGAPWHVFSYMRHHITGIMGLDRLFAAVAVACIPVCLSKHPWFVVWPLAVLGICMKGSAWVGAGVALIAWAPRWGWWLVPVASSLAWGWSGGNPALKLTQRGLTWWHSVQATGQHPFVGWGFSPMVLPSIRQQYGYLLPAVHSDWLWLAVSAGWGVVGIAAGLALALILAHPRDQHERLIRASLLGLLAISTVQSVLSHPRLGSIFLLLAVWWVVERSQWKECLE